MKISSYFQSSKKRHHAQNESDENAVVVDNNDDRTKHAKIPKMSTATDVGASLSLSNIDHMPYEANGSTHFAASGGGGDGGGENKTIEIVIIDDESEDDERDERDENDDQNPRASGPIHITNSDESTSTNICDENKSLQQNSHIVSCAPTTTFTQAEQAVNDGPLNKEEDIVAVADDVDDNDDDGDDDDDDIIILNESNGKIVTEEPVSKDEKETNSINPFAQFAFQNHNGQEETPTSFKSYAPSSSTLLRAKTNSRLLVSKKSSLPSSSSSLSSSQQTNKSKSTKKLTTKKKRVIQSKKEKADIPFEQMTTEEKQRCFNKWHSFADKNAPLETRRFQIMIAARLHCQAHESVVRTTMSSLKEFVTSAPITVMKVKSDNTNVVVVDNHDNDNGNHDIDTNIVTDTNSISFLDAESLSSADPNEIAKVISSVLFANVKAKQIVKAAYEIKTRFRGVVPESEHGLKMITGVGPKLAGVLHRINRRKDHEESNTLEKII